VPSPRPVPLSSAHHSARKECEVGFGTSKSNSGIIHAGHNGPAGTLKGNWMGRNQMWDALHDELDFGFRRNGNSCSP